MITKIQAMHTLQDTCAPSSLESRRQPKARNHPLHEALCIAHQKQEASNNLPWSVLLPDPRPQNLRHLVASRDAKRKLRLMCQAPPANLHLTTVQEEFWSARLPRGRALEAAEGSLPTAEETEEAAEGELRPKAAAEAELVAIGPSPALHPPAAGNMEEAAAAAEEEEEEELRPEVVVGVERAAIDPSA